MPEIKFPSEWLKINDNVLQGDTIVFEDAGTYDEERENYNFKVSIKHNGVVTETKKFTLNRTNFKVVSATYGSNSDNWIGKEMEVIEVKVRNPSTGLFVDGISLVEPKK